MNNNYNYTDTTPYLLRQTGNGDITVYGTNREDDTLVGGTVNVNQLATFTSSSFTENGLTIVRDASKGTYTINGTATARTALNLATKTGVNGHKVFLKGCPAGGSLQTYYLSDGYGNYVDIGNGIIGSKTVDNIVPQIVIQKDTVCNNLTFVPQLIDLTTWFGSPAIADYLYALEQATAGTGVAKLKEWGFLAEDYYEHNVGTLESVEARSHVMTGKNIFGGLKMAQDIVDTVPNATLNETDKTVSYSAAYITGKTLYKFSEPNTQYTIIMQGYNTSSGATAVNIAVRYEGGTTAGLSPFVNGVSITVTDASRKIESLVGIWATSGTVLYYEKCGIFRGVLDASQFEPYSAHTYDLGTDTLRGLFKLDSNNNLYADGDRKASDGTIIRKYGVVDLGTLNWKMSSNVSRFYAKISPQYVNTETSIFLTEKYTYNGYGNSVKGYYGDNLTIRKWAYGTDPASAEIYIHDDAYTDAASFKAAMSGVMLVYELATPITEQGDPFPSPQVCYPDGTEEYITGNGVSVGHVTSYFVGETEIVEPTIEHVLDYNGLAYLWTRLKQRFSSVINLVNGNATGSVRNIYSNSQYTMGNTATALGYQSKSSGSYSFSEGEYTVASGQDAHAEGSNTTASGLYSHSQGSGTIASGFAQTALGQFNVSDSDSTYAVIIGNGLQNTSRSNALTVDWNGNVYIQGTVQTSASEALYQSTPAYPSSAQSHGIWMYDSSGTKTEEHRIAGYQAYIGTTGNVYSSLYAYKSDGSADKACIEAVYKNSDDTKYITANCDVNVTGRVIATTGVGTNNKGAAADGITGVWINNAGNVHLTGAANGGSYIYFYYNQATSATSYITETASGTITVGGHLKTTSRGNIYGGSAIGTGGRTSNTDVSTSGSWLTSDGCLSFVRDATSGGLIQFHYNSAASATSTISENASGQIRISGKLVTGGAIYTGAKTTSSAGTGCYIGTDGTMALQSATTGSNAYGAANPHITFLNSDASQNIQLIFTDYDSVQSPASLTVVGNQGGEFLIVPQLKVTQNIHGNGKCAFRLNTDNWLRINDLGNYSSGVYFGTNTVRADAIIQSGHAASSSGYSYINLGDVFAGKQSGEPKVFASILNSSGSVTNRIYMYANADGRVGIYSVRADGTAAPILSRANNTNTVVIATGLSVTTTNATISTTAGTGVYFKVKNSHHEGSLYVSDSSTGNFGLYSNTLGKWVIYTQNTNGYIYLPPIAANVVGGMGNLFINSSGRVAAAASSSKRYKHDIQPLTDYRKILSIPVVSFKYNEGYLTKGDQYEGLDVPGLIAEDVARYYPIAAMYENNQVENWNTRHIVPAMLAVEQDHEKQIKLLTERVEQLSQENEQLKQRIEAIA